MNSLRARLTWGVALVTVVPLALAMLVLAHRIRQAVSRDASRLLVAEMADVKAQLADDGARMAAQLRVLGGDATLKRLFLVRPPTARDLAEDLALKRFLLGLDRLAVTDTSGAIAAADSADGTAPLLIARAPLRYQGEVAGWLEGGIRIDAARLRRLTRPGAQALILIGADGGVAAATLDSAATTVPSVIAGAEPARVRVAGGAWLAHEVTIELGAGRSARLIGLASTGASDRMIATLQIAALLWALLGVGVAIALGALVSAQLSRPVEQIAGFSKRLAAGEWDEPLRVRGVRELQILIEALDRMRDDLRSYRTRLVTSERQAAWGLMARQVAHEVKNPLTPIAISVADLKRSFEQGRADFPQVLEQATRTVSAEIESLKRLLREFSDFGALAPPRLGRVEVRALLLELGTLYARDIEAGRLAVAPGDEPLQLTADADQLRQALINLIKNALEAIGPQGHVTLAAAASSAAVEFTVADDGPGLNDEQRARLFTPGFSSKPGGAGLGLTIVERIAVDHGGAVSAEAVPGGGTRFRLRIPIEPRS